ncbi:MAG TPA: hypothetical protein VG015_02360, partial [Candidatus Dormibacteraeota bacterium]|nr:hypothetical protein [Candidatus Dormibacteraeota bacterium]
MVVPMRRYFGPRTLLLGSVFIVILAQLISAVRDPDFWWHIRTGQWILDHGRLPGHDLFTFTVPPSRVWTDHEYLSEVLMWLIYSHFGVAAFSLAIGLMTWLSFWLIYQRAGGGTQPYVVVGIAIALGVMAGAPIFGPRAQMVTFFFTCLELLWIERFLARGSRPESTRRRFPAMYLFPLLMVLWVNMHGSWIFGLGLLGIVLASEALLWLVNRDDRHKENCQRLGAVLVLSCLTPLLTPNGPALLAYPLVTQGSQAQQSLIVEWLSPDFHSASIHPFEAMLLLLFVGMILQRPRLRDLLLSLAVVVLSLQSVRHMVLFVAVATPILIEVWAGVWRQQVNLHPRLGTLGA